MTTATKTRSTKKTKPEANGRAGDEHDQDRADVDNSLEKLREECDKYNSQMTALKRKFTGAQNKVRNAEIDFENADKLRKNAKAALDKAIADELAMVNRFIKGEQDLPFPETESSKAAKQDPAPIGNDHAGSESIDALLAKNIKKIAGTEAFDTAKDRDAPIGMTEKQLDILKAAEINTIADLEKRMREDEWWHKKLKGIGEDKINRLTDTLLAYRLVYPVPTEPDKPAEPAAETEPATDAPKAEETSARESTAA